MNTSTPAAPVRRLRQRLIDDMTMRRFSPETQRNDIRDVGRFATFLRRSPDTATAEDLRRFQLEQREAGVPVPTMNSIVSAPRARPASHSHVSCWPSRRRPTTTRRRTRSTCVRRALAAAGAWSSSRPSRAGASPAHRLPPQSQPGAYTRDPARLATLSRRSTIAAADIRARAIDRYRGLKGLCCRSSPPKRPPDRAMVRCIRLTPTASPKRSGRAQDQPQTEIPIGHRPGPAGSFLGDFRTPIGARNSSRQRTVLLGR